MEGRGREEKGGAGTTGWFHHRVDGWMEKRRRRGWRRPLPSGKSPVQSERADLPLHLAWARFLALRHWKDARPRLGSVCPNHGRFISTREKVPSHVGFELRQRERGPLSLGECGQFGTGRERNAITHVPRGSRPRPPQYRGRRPPGPRPAPLTTDAFGIQQTDYCALRWLWWLVMVGA